MAAVSEWLAGLYVFISWIIHCLLFLREREGGFKRGYLGREGGGRGGRGGMDALKRDFLGPNRWLVGWLAGFCMVF